MVTAEIVVDEANAIASNSRSYLVGGTLTLSCRSIQKAWSRFTHLYPPITGKFFVGELKQLYVLRLLCRGGH